MKARTLNIFANILLCLCAVVAGCGPLPGVPPQSQIKNDTLEAQIRRQLEVELDAANSLDDFHKLYIAYEYPYLWRAKFARYLTRNPSFKAQMTKQIASQRRQTYVGTHLALPPQARDDISKGSIRLGMTKEQVVAALGKPDNVNRTVYTFGVHEQWVYGEYGWLYAYFEDGVLTSWQD